MTKRKALLIGDYERAKFHPLTGFDQQLTHILSTFDITTTTDYDSFQSLTNYDLSIAMIDTWKPLSTDQTWGLMSYVFQGGGLLLIHQGISLQASPELTQMIRGRFTHHPEQKVLTYVPKLIDHPILKDVTPFSVKEEPYQFITDTLVGIEVLLEYELDGKVCPAAWAHTYGKGRICYLSPGHNLTTLFDSSYITMIQNSALWLTKKV